MTITDRMAAWRRERRVLLRAAWRLEQAERERSWALRNSRMSPFPTETAGPVPYRFIHDGGMVFGKRVLDVVTTALRRNPDPPRLATGRLR